MHRQGLRLSLSHIAEGEWRAMFMGHPMFAPTGYGVAATPWRAVQQAAWATLTNTRRAQEALDERRRRPPHSVPGNVA
jgi:hypothetical protein